MEAAVPKLNIIAAMCNNRGIGYKNSLPWDLNCAPPGSYLARNLDQAIDMIQNGPLKEKSEQIFAAGGTGVYQEFLDLKYPVRMYLTKIQADFKCDTFFPEFSEEIFTEVFGVPNVPTGEQEENGIKWTYHVYEKK